MTTAVARSPRSAVVALLLLALVGLGVSVGAVQAESAAAHPLVGSYSFDAPSAPTTDLSNSRTHTEQARPGPRASPGVVRLVSFGLLRCRKGRDEADTDAILDLSEIEDAAESIREAKDFFERVGSAGLLFDLRCSAGPAPKAATPSPPAAPSATPTGTATTHSPTVVTRPPAAADPACRAASFPEANRIGADYCDPPYLPPAQPMTHNRKWINDRMDEGRTIVDFGAAPGRKNYPNPTSPYYQIERDEIGRRDYKHYIPPSGRR